MAEPTQGIDSDVKPEETDLSRLDIHPPTLAAHNWRDFFGVIARTAVSLAVCLLMLGCRQPAAPTQTLAVVGTWFVTIPEAPFPYHLFVFHSDGTVLQSNPDAGDANTSDSNLMGAWIAEGDHIRGKLVETAADRVTHRFVSRGKSASHSRFPATSSMVRLLWSSSTRPTTPYAVRSKRPSRAAALSRNIIPLILKRALHAAAPTIRKPM